MQWCGSNIHSSPDTVPLQKFIDDQRHHHTFIAVVCSCNCGPPSRVSQTKPGVVFVWNPQPDCARLDEVKENKCRSLDFLEVNRGE
jgi:hypothetical protein